MDTYSYFRPAESASEPLERAERVRPSVGLTFVGKSARSGALAALLFAIAYLLTAASTAVLAGIGIAALAAAGLLIAVVVWVDNNVV